MTPKEAAELAFVTQALRGEPLTLHGDGSQTRSFCYVDDLIEGLVRMMRREGEQGPVNLGNPDERTVADLALLIADQVGTGVEVELRPMPADDPKRRKPDISKAKELLGWEPKVSLEEGIGRTVEWFREAGCGCSIRAATT